jgi:hypothetical protein
MDLTVIPEDMTPEEKKELEEFKKAGCPGIQSVDDNLMFQFFELYMAGKTYGEIATYTKRKKAFVLYVSSFAKWHDKRMAHYQNITEKMLEKVQQAKMEAVNTITMAISAYSKLLNSKFNKFVSQNDFEAIESLQNKEMQSYYKAIDTLNKLVADTHAKIPPKDSPSATVNVNVGNNATITKKDENTFEVKANDSSGDVLKELVKNKRAARNKK